jgi:hypothetical protein
MTLHQVAVARSNGRSQGTQVRVSLGVHDGWDVAAMRDGRVVEVRHCQDWHRVERTRRRMESELQRPAHPIAAAS